MSEAALEEVCVLSSMFCREGEFLLLSESAQDGIVVQINCAVGGDGGLEVSLVFHLHPRYPSCPPDISVSSTGLCRTECHNIRQKLLDRAASLTPEPMVHHLIEYLQQCVDSTKGGEDTVTQREMEDWTAVLLLDHMRSQNRYIGLLDHWSQQLQLAGRLLLGQNILVVLQGARSDIKEFCRRLKTVKVDVDSSGKKCKERRMKVLIESPTSSSCQPGLQGFVVKTYQSVADLTEAFQELHMAELYLQIRPSLSF